MKPTVAVDFDGVLADGTETVAGAKLGVRRLARHYRLVVFTARADLDYVRYWLVRERMDGYFAEVTNSKPQARVYLDDRAVRFDGWAGAVDAVKAGVRA